ncbi:MAG: acyl carrier protein [Polyangiaceae bacterium]|nr:acyl carrier protein [Polyangiaceae bacterium]
MNASELEVAVKAALARVAPEADLDALGPEVPLRDELDLDSMDFLAFVAELHTRTGVAVPEADYGKLGTLAAAVAYLGARAR